MPKTRAFFLYLSLPQTGHTHTHLLSPKDWRQASCLPTGGTFLPQALAALPHPSCLIKNSPSLLPATCAFSFFKCSNCFLHRGVSFFPLPSSPTYKIKTDKWVVGVWGIHCFWVSVPMCMHACLLMPCLTFCILGHPQARTRIWLAGR